MPLKKRKRKVNRVITYQDYERATDKTKWLRNAIISYRNSKEYKAALDQESYMDGQNTAILEMTRIIYNMAGLPETDFTASNFKLMNRQIHRMVTDRCSYSLGNGISFASAKKEKNAEGKTVTVDRTKEMLGDWFDKYVYDAAYWAQANGKSFLYVHMGENDEKWEYTLFKMTEFLPLYDERTGALRGGVRFWSLEWGKRPITAVLYLEEGYIRYETPEKKYGISALAQKEDLKPYIEIVEESEAYGEEVVGTGNLSRLPIFPMYSGAKRSSVLDNQKGKIDAYDMISSGFANDVHDCAQVYWLISGAMGMTEKQKKQLLDRLILQHMAVIDGENSSITPYTQEIPWQAREKCLQMLETRMYKDFGGFDVQTIQAGDTNDHVEAAYWPMDEEADAFEYEVIAFVQQILGMMGVQDVPQFKRNRVSNQKEQTEMVILAADHLDERTILEKLPWITVDEVDDILARRDMENAARFDLSQGGGDEDDDLDDGTEE